ncbi:hypothetical protein ACIBCR_15295 [Micromonospora echinospora]|uniref:hypothetical protein n=1 Tax=Micromonospora echinospora TaxID=1877 RepID=UPI0037B818C5
MTKPKLPTRSQAYLIAFFAGQSFPKVRTNEATYKACRTSGWIERTDEHPYHQTTTVGLAALAAYQQAQKPTPEPVDVEHVMGLVRAYGQECRHGAPTGDNAIHLLDLIRAAITSKEA